jgi:hypothetical protein
VLVGLAMGALGTGAYFVAKPRLHEPLPAAPAASPPPSRTQVTSRPQPGKTTVEPGGPESSTPIATPSGSSAAPPAARGGRVATASTASAPPSAGIADELLMLEQARTALRAGRPAAALEHLKAHSERFASPSLGAEANVLRVEALLALGQRAQARALGQKLLAGGGLGVHAQRVRSLLGLPDAGVSP